jgi:hypothetical protein
MDNTSEIQNAIAFFKRCGVPYADTALAALQSRQSGRKGAIFVRLNWTIIRTLEPLAITAKATSVMNRYIARNVERG